MSFATWLRSWKTALTRTAAGSSRHPRKQHRRPRSHVTCQRLEDPSLLRPGALDPTFGAGGSDITDIALASYDNPGYGQPVAIQADGKVVVVDSDGNHQDFVLARYNGNGSLDASFGSGGIRTIDFASSFDVANA